MKKLACVLFAGLCVAALAGCGEEAAQKPVTGIDPCFTEELGYYNESPSVLRTGNRQYMFYTRNEVISDNSSDSIAVRSAVWTKDGWHWSDAKKVLSKSESGWDSGSVFGADVIKGEFTYRGNGYSYLMAYAGSEKVNRSNAQIGFAVSNSIDGEYIRVGEAPVVSFDKTEQTPVGLTNYKGANEPSLVSFDKKGKLTLFYSFYGKFECSYAVEMDCSNLDAIVRGGRRTVNTGGLADGQTNTALYGGDYAYDSAENAYVVCRNYAGAVSGLPAVSEAIQAVTASADEIFAVNGGAPGSGVNTVWSLYNPAQRRVSALHTSVDDENDMSRSGGYKRIYNGCVASDEYGHTVSTRRADIYFTSSAVSGDEGLTGDEYAYTPMIHEFIIERG